MRRVIASEFISADGYIVGSNCTKETSPGADKMNQTLKVVLPRTLKEAPCRRHQPATIIENHMEEKIRELKEKPGKNIIIYGSANAVQNSSRIGLNDEYQLLVHQVFLGSDTPLFSCMWRQMNLKPLRTGIYRNGVSVLYYQPRSLSRVAG